jgi:hypothetical protein
MTLTIDLPAELESRLKAEAEAHDQTPAQWLLDLAAWELTQRELEDAEDLETLRYRRENPDPRPRKTMDDFRAHLAAQSEHKQAA